MKKVLIYGILIIGVVLLVIMASRQSALQDDYNIIRVGYRAGNMNYGPFYVADKKDYFTEQNIKIEHVPLGSANDIKLAISVGQIDIALGASTVFFVPMAKGIPIRIVAPMAVGPMHLVVRDDKIKTFADLAGKSFAVSQGGPSESFVRYVLEKEGVDVSSVEFVYVDKVYRPSALMDQKIVDVLPVGEDELGQYLKMGAITHKEWTEKGYTLQSRLEEVIVVADEFDNAHPLLAEKFIDSIIKGHRFIKSNPEESSLIVASDIKVGGEDYSAEFIRDIWKENKLIYMLWYDAEILKDMSRIAVDIGQIESELTLEQIYNPRFENKLKQAQDEIYPTN